MRAVSVAPGVEGSLALEEVETAPGPTDGILVRTSAVGVCGTDRAIIAGQHGAPVPGRNRLIIGHESLGVVERAPPRSGFSPGDRVAGIVRRPDPVPCHCCASGEWDMCSNGRYMERGIKGLDGFACERFFVEPDFAVKLPPGLKLLGVLIEPASILAKAWRRIDAFAEMSCQRRQTVLVTGAGPIGLLAALLAVQRGLDVHVLDRVTSGPKPDLVEAIGAAYHTSSIEEACPKPDITLECTGVGHLVLAAMTNSGRNGIVCLTGVSAAGEVSPVDAGSLNREVALGNHVIFGTVNANRGDYVAGAVALQKADRNWLARLITRRVPLANWREAYSKSEGDVKTVLVFDAT